MAFRSKVSTAMVYGRLALRCPPGALGAGAAAGYPPQEILRIADSCSVSMRNMTQLDTWVRNVGLPVDPALPLMCLQTAFLTPWMPAGTCFQISQLTMWITALGNVMEDPDADLGELASRVVGWPRGIEGDCAVAADPLAVSLAEISANLQRVGRSEVLAFWHDTMHEILTGMWPEREAVEAAVFGELPRPQRYLLYGAWSIGVEQQQAALWTLMDEPDLPRRLPALRSALRHAAQAIRLLNDLRGHHREQARGRVDALTIGLSTDEVRSRSADGMEGCRPELASLTTSGYGPAVALERVLLWHTRMHQCFDPVHSDHEVTDTWPGVDGVSDAAAFMEIQNSHSGRRSVRSAPFPSSFAGEENAHHGHRKAAPGHHRLGWRVRQRHAQGGLPSAGDGGPGHGGHHARRSRRSSTSPSRSGKSRGAECSTAWTPLGACGISADIAGLRTTCAMGLAGLQKGILELDYLDLGTGNLMGIVDGGAVLQVAIPS